jgi:hypothetical protein
MEISFSFTRPKYSTKMQHLLKKCFYHFSKIIVLVYYIMLHNVREYWTCWINISNKEELYKRAWTYLESNVLLLKCYQLGVPGVFWAKPQYMVKEESSGIDATAQVQSGA